MYTHQYLALFEIVPWKLRAWKEKKAEIHVLRLYEPPQKILVMSALTAVEEQGVLLEDLKQSFMFIPCSIFLVVGDLHMGLKQLKRDFIASFSFVPLEVFSLEKLMHDPAEKIRLWQCFEP